MDPTAHNPYQPPQPLPPEAWPQPSPQGAYPQWQPRPYAKPLGGYAVAAIVAMGVQLVVGLALDITLLLTVLVGPTFATLLQILAAVANPVSGLAWLLAAIFFLMWVHAAASNLHALQRPGMNMSPGWCVGWFFVPLANFVMPYRALAQIWNASDPGTALGGRSWQTTPLLLVWWGSFLISRTLVKSTHLMDKDDVLALGIVELIGNGLGVVAMLCIASIMRDVIESQKKLFAA